MIMLLHLYYKAEMKKLDPKVANLIAEVGTDTSGKWINVDNANQLVKLVVYDFLNELTNDDTLGEAMVATITRLAEKWGVSRVKAI